MSKKYSDKLNVQLITESLLAMGVNQVVCSPGSRNGALMMHFANHPKIQTHSIVDERSAAFVALGMAQKTQQPIVLSCTSGSAAANYYPAITEAYYQNIPLIVLTADRPKNYTDIFDGQTIRQENLYEQHSYYNTQLIEEEDDEALTSNFLEIKKAITESITNSGPVHINMPFSEPLYTTTSEIKINFEKISIPQKKYTEIPWESLDPILQTSQKIMILVGQQQVSPELNRALETLARLPQVVVLTENISNVHFSSFISRIDNVLFEMQEKDATVFQPDLLITLGQNIISKKIKQFIRSYSPKEHWHVNPYWQPDTYFCLTQKIINTETHFAVQLAQKLTSQDSQYKENWLQLRARKEERQTLFLDNIPFSDLWVYKNLIPLYPPQTVVQYSNSSVIRYSQLFNHDSSLQIFCNRGTSGIDGSTSTAVGFAMKTEKIVTLVTGDISFFYDSNALWNNKLPCNLRIIVVNNGGGDIFKIIPGPEDSGVVETHFSTEHQLSARPLAELYGLDYECIEDELHFIQKVATFYQSGEQAKILEINTSGRDNASVMRKYFKA